VSSCLCGGFAPVSVLLGFPLEISIVIAVSHGRTDGGVAIQIDSHNVLLHEL
jgi:hypothetical protein